MKRRLLFVLLLLIAGTGSIWLAWARDPRGHRSTPVAFEEPIQIRVIGEEFRWHFLYPGKDAAFGTEDDIDGEHELRIPVATPCQLEVTSKDNVYALSLSPFDAREIAVPDRVFTLTFQADHAGQFEIRVDPLCGFLRQHDDVMAMLRVMPVLEFADWYHSHH